MSETRGQPSKALTGLVLIVIVLTGAFLGFHNITQYEPFITDEAAYHLEARYLYSLIQAAWESLKLKHMERATGENLWRREQEAKRFKEGIEGRVPWYARPGHLYLLLICMKLVGPDKVYVGGLVSALFGTLSIPLLCLIGTRLYNRGIGLLASAVFSLSAYQVAYCHSGLTEQDSLFFIMLGTLAYVCGRDRTPERRRVCLLAAGAALGISFVIHYRVLTVILAFVLWEAFLQPYKSAGGRRERAVAMVLLLTGVMVPVILAEVPYYVVMLLVHMFFKAALPFQTYFEQLIGQVFVSIYTNLMSTQHAFSLANLLTYPYLIWKLDGPLWPVVLLASLIVCAKRRSPSDKLLAALFLVPFLLCTLLQPRARYACSFLPFGVLLMASFIGGDDNGEDHRRLSRKRLLYLCVTCALLVISTVHSLRATVSRVSYGHAMDFLVAHGARRHISTIPVLSQTYMGVRNVPDQWPASEEDLHSLYGQGYKFVVMDLFKDAAALFLQQFDIQGNPSFKKRLAVLDQIEDTLQPVYTTENLHAVPIQNIFEVNHNFLKTLSYYRQTQESPRMHQIRVYDLAQRYDRASTQGTGNGQE